MSETNIPFTSITDFYEGKIENRNIVRGTKSWMFNMFIVIKKHYIISSKQKYNFKMMRCNIYMMVEIIKFKLLF
jgi:hypothetical protein